MKRRLLLFVASVALALAFVPAGSQVFATDDNLDNPNLPAYQYVEKATVSLSISKGGTATASTVVKDYDGDTTKISCTMTLQKYSSGSWRSVKSWSKTTASNTLSMSKTKSVSKGKYRVKSTIKAYKGNKSESFTKYSSTVTY